MYAHLHGHTYTPLHGQFHGSVVCHRYRTETPMDITNVEWGDMIGLQSNDTLQKILPVKYSTDNKVTNMPPKSPSNTDTHYIYKLVWFTAASVSVKLEFGWGHHTSGVWHSFETPFSELKLLSPTEHSRNSFSIHMLLLRYLNGDMSLCLHVKLSKKSILVYN